MTGSGGKRPAATSTELTGGSGFSYEDAVVAYYLTALLREEGAAGQSGIVTRVAVQQAAQGEPLDDIIVDTSVNGMTRRLSLQAKRQVVVSAARSNGDFRWIIKKARETRKKADFRAGEDRYGFVAEFVAEGRYRGLKRLIDWASGSPLASDFERRFAPNGGVGKSDRSLRESLQALIEPKTLEEELNFYRHFVALRLDGLDQDQPRFSDTVNRLSELLAADGAATGAALFHALCRHARTGAGTGKIWTRSGLLKELKPEFRLRSAPSYAHDVGLISERTTYALNDVNTNIDGIHLDRQKLISAIRDCLAEHRFVNISGQPGTGKSALLRGYVESLTAIGPVLFLAPHRLSGDDWVTFANSIGLQHRDASALLSEIGARGNAVLCIDGIDRVKPSARNIISDLINAIHQNPDLDDWKVLVTSRDQGLEALRSWFPVAFYKESGIGDIPVLPLDDFEAEQLATARPALRSLLFGPQSVREIARRPFFAAVLAGSFVQNEPAGDSAPKSEIELIDVWWQKGGYDSDTEYALSRQRALLLLAEVGAPSLGRAIAVRDLGGHVPGVITNLVEDHVIRWTSNGHVLSFTHDIFFEWAFLRLLVDAQTDWLSILSAAGEPPLLGRIVALLSQYSISNNLGWTDTYRLLETKSLRPQWQRAWLTGPPASPEFLSNLEEFHNLLVEQDFRLYEKFLVWFQAEHTIPNPLVLARRDIGLNGAALLRAADALGWPSNVDMWVRVIRWIISSEKMLPRRLVPRIVEVLSVWQNAFAGIENSTSTNIVDLCAKWFTELQDVTFSPFGANDSSPWNSIGVEAQGELSARLLQIVLGAARTIPGPAKEILHEALRVPDFRRQYYRAILEFSIVLSEVAPEVLADLARQELMGVLPKDEIYQDRRAEVQRRKLFKRIRDKPEHERTADEKRALEAPSFVGAAKHYDLEEIGFERYSDLYNPLSPVREPFGSLFKSAPECARSLVRDIANHGIEAWLQVHELERHAYGTPIPLDLDFPRGRERFWGDARVYAWGLGDGEPPALGAAIFALAYWGHQEIDKGRCVDEVIKDVLEGHRSCAPLRIAASLALEMSHVSREVLPLAICQRLWHSDYYRVMNDNSERYNPLALDIGRQLSTVDTQAISYMLGRKSRRCELRDLAHLFVLNADSELSEKFKSAVAEFPNDLPFVVEEEKGDEHAVARYLETAKIWSGLGDPENYRVTPVPNDPSSTYVAYERQTPLPAETQARVDANDEILADFSILRWAQNSLEKGEIDPRIELEAALQTGRLRDSRELFASLAEPGAASARQSAVSALAALVITMDVAVDGYHDWAWSVLERIEAMKESPDPWGHSDTEWHPVRHLICGLQNELRSQVPRQGVDERLFNLVLYPNRYVAAVALRAILGLNDVNPALAWSAAVLASKLCIQYADERDTPVERMARSQKEVATVLEEYRRGEIAPLESLPSAWTYAPPRERFPGDAGAVNDVRRDPDVYFDYPMAARTIDAFAVEAWYESEARRPLIDRYLRELISWTASRLAPDESARKGRSRSKSTEGAALAQWSLQLASLVARSLPYIEPVALEEQYLKPIGEVAGDDGAMFLAQFAQMTTCYQVYDAEVIRDETLIALDYCLEQLLAHPVFDRARYRAGEIYGFDLPYWVRALMFVYIEQAGGAKRFANGDWRDLPQVMPIIDKFIRRAGWARAVMEAFLTLCERAGGAYPIEAFASQMITALDSAQRNRGIGPDADGAARVAGVVQVLAESNYPLGAEQSKELLRVLDALIDLGDRRAAALEQSEAFRNTQTL